MLVIGLTGGIASGKTTISNLFALLEAPVIDTDIISRELLNIDQPGYQKVVAKLGNAILRTDRSIDRKALREKVFTDLQFKIWLESKLHPLILNAVKEDIDRNSHGRYVVVVVPLLFEAKFTTLVDRILVVDCPREVQMTRLIARDNIDETLASKMLDQQWSNTARLERADDVILNDSEVDLQGQVERLHQQYIRSSK